MNDIFCSFFVLIGAAFILLAAVGMVRFPDVYMRMHAATKAGTLGAGTILVGLAFHAGQLDVTLKVVIGVIFLIITGPIASHLLGRAAYATGVDLWEGSVVDDMHGRYGFDGREPGATPLNAKDYE